MTIARQAGDRSLDAIGLMIRVFVDEGVTPATTGETLLDESRLQGQGALVLALIGNVVLGAVLIVSPTADVRQVVRDQDD
jgi:hypothetical protein